AGVPGRSGIPGGDAQNSVRPGELPPGPKRSNPRDFVDRHRGARFRQGGAMGRLDEDAAHALAAAAGIGPVRAIAAIDGGANNRAFRLETADAAFFLKSYFRHPDDPRDRLGAEFAFSQFAWSHGVRCIPQPLACDAEAGLGLFEFVHGQSLKGTVAAEAAVEQAIAFFRCLNRSRTEPEAAKLGRASESCL